MNMKLAKSEHGKIQQYILLFVDYYKNPVYKISKNRKNNKIA